MVCPGQQQQQHTYLLSLGFQGLQVVGHSFQLFLKLRAFAGVLHAQRRGEEEGEDEEQEQEEERYIEKRRRTRSRLEILTSGNRKREERRGTKETKPKINQNWGGGQGETEITQQECAVMICCMQIATPYKKCSSSSIPAKLEGRETKSFTNKQTNKKMDQIWQQAGCTHSGGTVRCM